MNKTWLSILAVAFACACSSSSNSGPSTGTGGTGTGGTTTAGTGTGGMTTAGTGTGGTAAGGSTGAAGSAAGGAGAGGASASTDGGAPCPFQGKWKAVQYSCGGGAPQTIPPIVTFNIDIEGTSGMFVQTNSAGGATCMNSNNGSATCAGNMATFGQGITMCSPANCLSRNQCGAVPDPIVWTFTQGTATTLTTVSTDPTPLTTCTDQGQPNPVAFYWQKQ